MSMTIASASVSVSAIPDFELALTYALRRLGTPQLRLKDEQKQAIEAILLRQGRFCVAAYRIWEECVLLQPSILAAVQVRFES